MNGRRTFRVATAPLRNSKKWTAGEVTWDEIMSWLQSPADHKEAGNYMIAVLEGNARNRDSVVSREMLQLDADYPAGDWADRVEMALPGACAWHTTFSSTPEKPRYRLLVPLSRSVTPAEYSKLCRIVMGWLGAEQFDKTTDQASRYMFKPATADPETYAYAELTGDELDVDSVLLLPDPELAEKPERPSHKRDPFEIEGTVGAFNRVYQDLDTLIEAYQLPYDETEPGRYKFRGATESTEAGMSAVGPGLWYSHHATDPAGGETCTAFDLMRLHSFSKLDADAKPRTPVNSLPSHKAALERAVQDERVIMESLENDFSVVDEPDAAPDGDVPHDWKMKLVRNRRTMEVLDCAPNWRMLLVHDPVLRSLQFNELTMAKEFTEDPPWRSMNSRGGPMVNRADWANLAMYLELEYKFTFARYKLEDTVEIAAGERWFNPVRTKLKNLKWDGKRRLETCLPGVKPTPYTRMVARKCLVAAVARMLQPGVKCDYSLVLFGPEGVGKTHWVDVFSWGYTASLGDINNKDTLINMQSGWITLSDEGYSLRKADAEGMKEFLTRTADTFRMPYDREATTHPRHGVIWGTTNDEIFLRRQQGNRRFLIVRCEEKVDFEALTPEYVDQVWAEAVHLYKQGEKLYLDDEQMVIAREEREEFTEEESLTGLFEQYLSMLVPDNWDEMTPENRVSWMAARGDGFTADGTEPINVVCSQQLWVEALGNRKGTHRRHDLLNITEAMNRLEGWESSTKPEWVKQYGSQRVFRRKK